MTLDPQIRRFLDNALAVGASPLSEQPLEQVRQSARTAATALFGPVDTVASVEDRTVPGPAGPISVRIYRSLAAGDATPGAFVWLHGGGWAIGDLESHDPICRALAARSGATVVAVDYRLAPEHVFPAAIDDAWAVTEWLARDGGSVGIDPARLVVGGDSAGGNLAAVVALRARAAGLALRLQVLVYPITDCDFSTDSYDECAEGFGLTLEGMVWFWNLYAPGDARFHPDASPLRADSLTGVAPALVLTAGYDVLRSEGEAYAARLATDGVPVTHTPFPGMTHGFLRMPAIADRANVAIDGVAAAVRSALA